MPFPSEMTEEELVQALGPVGSWPQDNNEFCDECIRFWLGYKGIPITDTIFTTPHKLRLAYSQRRYLNGWVRNIKNNTNNKNKISPPPPPRSGGNKSFDEMLDDIDNATAAKPRNEARGEAAELISYIDDKLNEFDVKFNNFIQNTKLELSDSAKENIKNLVIQTATETTQKLLPPRTIIITNPSTAASPRNIGLQHQQFETLLKACQARKPNGQKLNIWLTGPTQAGKTHGVKACAEALGLNFYADSSLDADYKVMGFTDANGNYHTTQFRQAFELGGLYLADEIDNWNPSALLTFNAPIANNWCAFPDKMVERHKDFIFVAAANTWGLGATNDYVGRSKLDAATMARFNPKINWPYDEKLELALAKNFDDKYNWCQIVQQCRKDAKSQGLQIIISPTTTLDGLALLHAGFSIIEVINMTFGAGLSEEVKDSLKLPVADVTDPAEGGGGVSY
jgi:hypothetical protein